MVTYPTPDRTRRKAEVQEVYPQLSQTNTDSKTKTDWLQKSTKRTKEDKANDFELSLLVSSLVFFCAFCAFLRPISSVLKYAFICEIRG
jgi:hypothetical protein